MKPNERQEFESIEGISRKIGLPISWLRLQIFRKTIPFYKIQGRIMFKVSEIESWLASKRITPSEHGGN